MLGECRYGVRNGRRGDEIDATNCGSVRPPNDEPPAAAVSGSAFGQHRLDAAPPQFATMRLRVVGPVPLNSLRPSARTPVPSGHGGNRIDQRQQLRDIVTVGSGDAGHQRNAAGIRVHMMLGSFFPRSVGLGLGEPMKNGGRAERW